MSGNQVTPLVQMRQCRGCPVRFPAPHPKGWHPAFHSPQCYRDHQRSLPPKPQTPRAQLVTRAPATPVRRSFTPASPEQHDAVVLRACAVCREGPCDPAHLIPRGLCPDTDGDPRAVVPLCRRHHDAYDHEGLDILPFLEPHFRVELAFAVERFGLLSTLRRVTNERESDHCESCQIRRENARDE